MAEITLSSAVRRNLLSLQNTAMLMGKTQERLATGKKVNSALDNPTNFFTAAALSSRSKDLSRLLDSVSNAVQTLEAADNGIKAITKLVESAQASARQALQAAPGLTTGPNSEGGDIDTSPVGVSSNTLSGLTGDITITTGVTVADGTGGSAATISVAGRTLDEVATDISALPGLTATVVAGTNPGEFKLNIVNANSGATDGVHIAEDGGDAAAVLGIAKTTDVAAITLSTVDVDQNNVVGTAAMDIPGLSTADSMTFDIDGTLTTVDLTGTETIDQIAAKISNVTGLKATVEAGATAGTFKLDVQADPNVNSFSVADATGTAAATLGIIGAHDTAAVTADSEQRANLQTEYNDLLTQINDLTNDAGYNGNNLLAGSDLKVIFNEDGSSSISIGGVDISAIGLGLSSVGGDDFQDNSKIEGTLGTLDNALLKLRSQASTFGSNLSVVQTRQDFTKNMMNTLETGAANLTLADVNQEGANMLALQTRQQLSTTALSMASQADQSVLSLF
ncbi:MAG: flagellin [Hyphomicrobiales bacterium]